MTRNRVSMSRKSLGRSKKGLADEAASLRLARLDQVFNKALDVAVSSVGEAELKECFRTVLAAEGGEKLSNSIQKAVANMLTETQASMIAGYKDVCIQRDLDEKLKALENLPPIDTNRCFLLTHSLTYFTLYSLYLVATAAMLRM